MAISTLSPEVENLKTRLKTIWMAGDYDRFSRYLENGAREFYERRGYALGQVYLFKVGSTGGQS